MSQASGESYIEINSKFFETFVTPEAADGEAEDNGKTKEKKKQGIPEEFVHIPEVPDSRLRAPFNLLALLGQPILGAFSAKFKRSLRKWREIRLSLVPLYLLASTASST